MVVESGQDSLNRVTDDDTLATVTQKRAVLEAGGNVTLASLAGNASVISSTLDSGGTIQINTPNGALYLGARKDLYDYREQSSSDGLFTTTYTNKGEIHETVVPTLMTAAGNIAIVTQDGTIVDYKDTGNLDESINQLSQAPGLAWMKDLQARSDVQWNAVQEAHQSWDYSSQGISPVGAILISLAVASATGGVGTDPGMGATLWGKLSSTAVGELGTTAVAVADAGFTALASQAAIAVVGNGGDLGAALKQLGSMDTIKSLATSMVTAGLIANLPLKDLGITTNAAGKGVSFMDKLKLGIAQATVSSTVDSVINGAPLDENLKSGLINAAVSTVGAEVATMIGQQTIIPVDATDSIAAAKKFQQLLSHAALGCGMGAATGGGCKSGAVGAVIGEVTAQFVDEGAFDGAGAAGTDAAAQKTALLAGQVAAVLTADAMGLDPQTAVDTAGNAIANNYLTPKERLDFDLQLANCNGDPYCEDDVITRREERNAANDFTLVLAELGCDEGENCYRRDHLYSEFFHSINIDTISADLRKAYPDHTPEQIQSLAQHYQSQAVEDFDNRNEHALTSTLDAVMLITEMLDGTEVTSFIKSPLKKGLTKLSVKQFAKRLGDIGPAIQRITNAKSVWELSPMERGIAIELKLGKTDYKSWTHIDSQMVGNFKPGMFPLVDYMKGKVALSVKSVDTTGKTWVKRMKAHIEDLASRGVTINGEPAEMMLDLRVQPGAKILSSNDLDQLQKLAERKNVFLKIVEHH